MKNEHETATSCFYSEEAIHYPTIIALYQSHVCDLKRTWRCQVRFTYTPCSSPVDHYQIKIVR